LNLTVLGVLFEHQEARDDVQEWLHAMPSSRYSRMAVGVARSTARGTRTCDHQHRQRVQECLLPVTGAQASAQQGVVSDQQHHRNKDGTHAVNATLYRRFLGLRRLDHTNDARERGLRAHRSGFHQQQ